MAFIPYRGWCCGKLCVSYSYSQPIGIQVSVPLAYTHYVYPGIYQYQDFHHCGLEPDDEIVNYDNRLEVQTCQLDNLAE